MENIYTAINLESIENPVTGKTGIEYIKVLVQSFNQTQKDCQLNIIFVNPPKQEQETKGLIPWLKKQNVNVIMHSLPNEFTNTLNELYDGQYPSGWHDGSYCRYDLHNVIEGDETLLYVDWDCYFLKPVDFSLFKDIKTLGKIYPFYRKIAPVSNVGVMALNTEFLRKQQNSFIEYLKKHIGNKNTYLKSDQHYCSYFWQNYFIDIPLEYNWMPRLGVNDKAVIIHMHQPKSEIIRKIINDEQVEPHKLELWHVNPQSCMYYFGRYEQILSTVPKI